MMSRGLTDVVPKEEGEVVVAYGAAPDVDLEVGLVEAGGTETNVFRLVVAGAELGKVNNRTKV